MTCLSRLFADVMKRVQVPIDGANWIAEALRESQGDKERFHRTAVMQLALAVTRSESSKTDPVPEQPVVVQEWNRDERSNGKPSEVQPARQGPVQFTPRPDREDGEC